MINEIIEKIKQDKFVVWIDDKQDARLTPEYMETHFVMFADSIEEGHRLCTKMQEEEREKSGRANARYRISGMKDDYVCSEDLSKEEIEDLTRRLQEKGSNENARID